MGKKYASIHIFTKKPEYEIHNLKNYYGNNNLAKADIQIASSVFNNTEVLRMFSRLADLWMNELLIVQFLRFISIYDETLSFESVEEKAEFISNNTDQPVLYASNFDGDVFIFGIFQAGKHVTGGKIGNGLSIYGLSREKIDIDKFFSTLSFNGIALPDYINTIEKIDIIEGELEKLLLISLNLTISDVRLENNHYVEMFTENGLCAYKFV